MRRPLMMALLPLCFGVLLTGCQPNNVPPSVLVQHDVIREKPPLELLSCGFLPNADQVRTQADVADYIVDMKTFGWGCWSKLQAVKEWADGK
jgi:hypothetical protein